MTRKRFIKLLMSHGKQRNEVEVIAHLYNIWGTPYSKAYRDFLLKHSFDIACKRLEDSFANATENIRKLCASFAALSLNLKESYINPEKERE